MTNTSERAPKSTTYAVLSGIAERLRATGSTANIDWLAADMQATRAAHAVCRDSLAGIRREIDAEMVDAQPAEGTA